MSHLLKRKCIRNALGKYEKAESAFTEMYNALFIIYITLLLLDIRMEISVKSDRWFGVTVNYMTCG